MLRNYLKIALRNLARHKVFSAINLGGLALAIVACLLIGVFVRHEYAYDRFHTHANRIYRVWTQERYEGQPIINPVTPYILGPTLQATYPQIEQMARVETGNVNVKKGTQVFNERIHLADPDLLTLFDFPLISGSKRPLQELYSAVISEDIAQKYFGGRNPLGQTLMMQLDSLPQAFTIRAVAKTPPTNSSIRFGILIPIAHVKAFRSERALKSWFSVVPETFVMLRQGTDPDSLKAQFPALLRSQLGDKYTGNNYVINLQPLIDIHLDMTLAGGSEPVSDPTYSYILGAVAFFILLIACINFMTLSLGRSVSRAQEVGLRKAIGALRSQIIGQFWSEAMLMIGAAILLGLGLAKLVTPLFSLLVNQPLDFNFDGTMALFLVGLLLIVGLVAGSYPALVLSGFQPVEVLKGKLSLRGDANWFRRSLVVIQFGLAVLLMVGTLVLNHQLHYLQTKSLGFQREQIVILPINKTGAEGRQLVDRLRNALTAQKQVLGVTASAFPLGNSWGQMGYTDEQKVYRAFHFNFVDPYFLPTYGIRVVQGRNFDPANSADQFGAYIVNQAFVKKFGLKDPIHEPIRGLKTAHRIIGVVDNFHYASLHSDIEPLLMLVRYDSLRKVIENISVDSPTAPDVSVKLVAGNLPASLTMLEQVWKATLPNEPFAYSFLSEDLQRQYAADQRLGQLVSIASGLSLLIACLGLFGLATLAVSRRTKEIGVRKVLGASVVSVVGLLAKDFLQLVVIGVLLACPLSWWAAHQWLANFAYRVSMPWWAFGLAGIGVLVIAFVTISLQSVKAARMNPVESLRTE
nr:ABC transporter permease [Spirosoma sp. KNUC1025]